MDAAPLPAAGPPVVSAERAFLSDARLASAVLNQARYPVLSRMFGVPREEANLLTFVLALSAASATYDALRRIIRHPWPLSEPDSEIAVFLVREAGFGIAGPKAREVQWFGTLIAVAALGGVTLPGLRRMLHSIHSAEQRVGQQRRRIYGTAVEHAQQGTSHDDPPRARRAAQTFAETRRRLGRVVARVPSAPGRVLGLAPAPFEGQFAGVNRRLERAADALTRLRRLRV